MRRVINLDAERDNLDCLNLAPLGLSPNAINNCPVHDLLNRTMIAELGSTGTVHELFRQPALNSSSEGGPIIGAGNGTSGSVAAMTQGQPVAVSNGEFNVPQAVVQALGRDFFDNLVDQHHQPSGG